KGCGRRMSPTTAPADASRSEDWSNRRNAPACALPPAMGAIRAIHAGTAHRAGFVPPPLDGELRGCQGTIVPCRSLFADVVENARKAAFSDPRFPALAAEELEKVEMEIS